MSNEISTEEIFAEYLQEVDGVESRNGSETLEDVTEKDVEEAYRAAVKDLHPDMGGDAEEFIQMKDAYENLLADMTGSGPYTVKADTIEEPADSSQYEDSADYQVNSEGIVSDLDEAIAQVQEAVQKGEEQIDAAVREVAGEELDAMEKLAQNDDLDPEDII